MSDVIEFACPECKASCQFSELQHAVRHAVPVCKTWVAHTGDRHAFLKLALMSTRGNWVLGDAGHQPKADTEADRKLRAEVVEQLHEGLKKL
jgi:hypothetical protein